MGRMTGEQEVTTVPAAPREFRIINKKFVTFGFLAIVLALIFFAFSGNSITGNVVKEGTEIEESDRIQVSAQISSLSQPIESKQKIETIMLTLRNPSSRLFIGKDGVTDLSGLDLASIEMKDFSGSITFDGSAITALKGTVSKLSINNLPTTAASDEIRVRIEEPLEYESLSLSRVYLSQYNSLEESGTLSLNKGKISMALEKESLAIEDFIGSLSSGEISNQGIISSGLSLDGYAGTVDVGGEFTLNVRK